MYLRLALLSFGSKVFGLELLAEGDWTATEAFGVGLICVTASGSEAERDLMNCRRLSAIATSVL